MPANLPPQYFDAEKRHRLAKSPEEKLRCLEEMLRIMPKHKGTEKLQGELKRKISKLRTESSKRSAGGRRSDIYFVEKAGAGQVALVGPPNVGKSLLVATLTHANAEVADYPFTTRLPLAGIMQFENVRIQLVDLPPIHPDQMEAWVFAVLRNADVLWIVVDLGDDDLLEHVDQLLEQLEGAHIQLVGEDSEPEDPERLPKKALVVANKVDLPQASDRMALLQELTEHRFHILPVSVRMGSGLSRVRKATFERLDVMRVYTKAPGKEPDMEEPVILPLESTVNDFAEQIHKDFAHKLKFARIWGMNKHDGQRVHGDYPLADGDILELHI